MILEVAKYKGQINKIEIGVSLRLYDGCTSAVTLFSIGSPWFCFQVVFLESLPQNFLIAGLRKLLLIQGELISVLLLMKCHLYSFASKRHN